VISCGEQEAKKKHKIWEGFLLKREDSITEKRGDENNIRKEIKGKESRNDESKGKVSASCLPPWVQRDLTTFAKMGCAHVCVDDCGRVYVC